MEKLDGKTLDLENVEKEKLKTIFPQCFVEGKLDVTKLLDLCGEYEIKEEERYNFTWNGKSECLKYAQERSRGTLRPCKKESKNFDTTDNIYIEGDNLEVLKMLQKSYYEKVKMIYIDPPYNTGKDFIYKDNFKDNIKNYKEITSQAQKSNPETMGRFHTEWLNMMYPRLRLAYNLLKEDGVIFISIDDNEVHNLRKVCDEVFGEENFVANIIWRKKTGASDAKDIATITEHILIYVKSDVYKAKIFTKNKNSYDVKRYKLKDEYVERRGMHYIDNLDRGGIQYSDSMNYPIECPNGEFTYPNGRSEFINDGWIWTWGKKKLEWGIKNGFIELRKSKSKKSGWGVYYKNYINVNNDDELIEKSAPHKNLILDIINTKATKEIKNIFKTKVFQYTKPSELIHQLVSYVNFDANDIILDFFSGSATTAHAVMQLNSEDGGNRKYIMVQLPEKIGEKEEAYKAGHKNICEIGKERIRRAGEQVIKELDEKNKKNMKDSKEKDLEENDKQKYIKNPEKLDIGFKVFKLDTSNIKQWDDTPIEEENEQLRIESITKKLNDMLDVVKDDRRNLDVVYEMMLKEGFLLTEKIIELDILGKKAYGVGEDIENIMLIVCLEENLTKKEVEEMIKYVPAYIIFSENSFSNIEEVENAKLAVEEVLGEGYKDNIKFKFI